MQHTEAPLEVVFPEAVTLAFSLSRTDMQPDNGVLACIETIAGYGFDIQEAYSWRIGDIEQPARGMHVTCVPPFHLRAEWMPLLVQLVSDLSLHDVHVVDDPGNPASTVTIERRTPTAVSSRRVVAR